MIQVLIAGAIVGLIATGAGIVIGHVAFGIFGLCGRFARVLDRTPNYVVIAGCFSVTALIMAYLTHG